MHQIDYSEIKAAIIDLDGVITKTMKTHVKAWKKMFDEYLKHYNKVNNANQPLFDIEKDYPPYIDGIPRQDGVRNFLRSRNINLPEGKITDTPGEYTVWGLSNKKMGYFVNLVKNEGVEIYPKTIKKIKQWLNKGLKTAVISSSQSCRYILEAAGIDNLFSVVVDGLVSQELGLKGKPSPDIFLEAAQRLSVTPRESLIVEDALFGVEAGKKGNFNLVIGIDRHNQTKALYEHGADIVVHSLNEID